MVSAALRVRYICCAVGILPTGTGGTGTGSWDPLALLGPVLGPWVCFDDLFGGAKVYTGTKVVYFTCIDDLGGIAIYPWATGYSCT